MGGLSEDFCSENNEKKNGLDEIHRICSISNQTLSN